MAEKDETRSDPAVGAGGDPGRAPLEASPRFAPPRTRRDFLGLAAIGSAVGAFGVASLGALRLPMPAVFPESSSKVKLGSPAAFPPGSETHLPELSMWVLHRESGLCAISTVCTHLGCIVARAEDGSFHCPCHGSRFAADGKVTGGPAPTGLHWLALALAPDGQIVVDKIRRVEAGSYFAV